MAQPLLEETIQWSRYGVECFIANAVVFLFYYIINLFMAGFTYQPNEPLMAYAFFIIPYIVVSLILAWSAQKTIVTPLKSNKLDGIRSKLIIHGILGLFFGLVIGIFVFFWADEKFKIYKKRGEVS